MQKQILVIAFITTIITASYAQIAFENGYFIDETGEKVECLIKNVDWRNNPKAFKYKRSQDGVIQEASIQSVKEFGFINGSKYIRAKTKIDRSSDRLSQMSYERNPNFQEEELFLKVLIEGQASLFFYQDDLLVRFFYSLDNAEIDQLVYKRYLIGRKISVNNYYKQQLTLKLKCDEIRVKDLERLNYTDKSLKKVLINYNECTNSNYTDYEPTQKKGQFNLTLRPGLNYANLEIDDFLSSAGDFDFGNNIGFRFGAELEYVLPYNKNKWRIIVEPTLQYFRAEQSKEIAGLPGGVLVSEVNYQSLEIPIGLRYCFFLNDHSKIFTNISFINDLVFDSSIEFLTQNEVLLNTLEVSSRRNIAIGVGYNIKDRYGFEIRYHTRRRILSQYSVWASDYSVLSMVIGYSIF